MGHQSSQTMQHQETKVCINGGTETMNVEKEPITMGEQAFIFH